VLGGRVVVGDAGEQVVLVDDLLISLDVFGDVIPPTGVAGEDDDLVAALLPGLIEKPQDEGGVPLGEIVSESPVLELTLVLFDAGEAVISKREGVQQAGGSGNRTYDRSRPYSDFMYSMIHFSSRPSRI
jgi:hypothetical protein